MKVFGGKTIPVFLLQHLVSHISDSKLLYSTIRHENTIFDTTEVRYKNFDYTFRAHNIFCIPDKIISNLRYIGFDVNCIMRSDRNYCTFITPVDTRKCCLQIMEIYYSIQYDFINIHNADNEL